ncbi:T9SS type B sorting domain-containing protein, partial [Crocinitomix algicola]|uniref:T9SS type B sorting domain-containing protein n=1 Tax=Crocinitomix algicola TaxID=1740263 RepID=UPI00158654A2
HRSASIDELTCVIVNRWGIVVHEMTDVTDEWDGTDNSGSPCKDGTYFYTYRYVTDNGTVKEGQGNIRLVSGN